MKASSINQLLITAALVGTLAACSGAQTPGAAPVVTTPIESAETPTAAVVEATAETTTEATTEATSEATTEATGEATAEVTTEAMTETTIVTSTTITSTEAATGTTTGSAGAVVVEPLDQAHCEAIQMAVDETLGVSTTLEEAEFVNTLANQEGQACAITATGTGEDFGNFLDVAQSLRSVLETMGWTENPAYIADSPTGTAFAYELDSQLAFVSVDWQPSEDAECPEDQPISACELEPSQQLYTIKLELVQAGQ